MTASAAVTCPFCDHAAAELISLFGSQLLLSQYRCAACGSYFEGLREDRATTSAAAPADATGGPGTDGHRAEH